MALVIIETSASSISVEPWFLSTSQMCDQVVHGLDGIKKSGSGGTVSTN